jgi:recombination protein RecA
LFVVCASVVMPSEKLDRAIGAIQVRFGDQALVRGTRLPPATPWPTGQPAIDRLSGIGGLPRGRVSVLQGAEGSGKMTLGQSLLAQATREHASVVVIDRRDARFDPWIPDLLGADLDVLSVVRPPTPAVAGEAAVALPRCRARAPRRRFGGRRGSWP